MPKRTQLVIEARALDITDMRALKPSKRYALTVVRIQAQLPKAMDDIAEFFIKIVRSKHHIAEERLRERIYNPTPGMQLIPSFVDIARWFKTK